MSVRWTVGDEQVRCGLRAQVAGLQVHVGEDGPGASRWSVWGSLDGFGVSAHGHDVASVEAAMTQAEAAAHRLYELGVRVGR